MHQHGRVATVIQNHVWTSAVAPIKRAPCAPPIFWKRLTLPCEHWNALWICDCSVWTNRNRGGGVILRGENIATCPAHLRAKINQGLNQDRGLNGHVQTAGDARALERKLALVLFACRHQAWHFVLGEFNFLAAKLHGGFA